jgi:SagB-type dehydrogenase family enzyme
MRGLNRDIGRALAYHNATKHSEWSVRSNPHYLDWANQPLPFKIYTTLDPIPLPRDAAATGVSTHDAISTTTVTASGESMPALDDLARILFFSAGITKKRTFPGGELYFRAASCTGALYQFELYVVCADLPGLPAGVYHFGPGDFALRRLRAGDYRSVLVHATAGEESVERAPITIVCAGTYWRNAWKYRTRAYRHFGWDNGTILANMLAMSAALQAPARVVLGFVDSEVNRLLDLDTDREVAFSMVAIGHTNTPAAEAPREMPALSLATVPLSESEVDYPELRQIHAASSLETAEEVSEWRAQAIGDVGAAPSSPIAKYPSAESIEQVILRRGSSRKFERRPISMQQLRAILHPSTRGVWPGVPLLNDVYVIINAVEGMLPGAYFYQPNDDSWHCLKPGDFRSDARYLGLQQDLPGDAAADVFFMADLDPILQRLGNRGYRAVQLEAGILGGKMYLAAYAQRLGATGLTFFDDEVTQFFSPHAGNKSAIFLVALGKGRRVH